MNSAYAIQIRGLTKRYKNGVLANDAIDLDVPRAVFTASSAPTSPASASS